jgi:proteasome assembly chaperone (PAC2) family protein
MAITDYIRMKDLPQLHNTLLIAAFSGWNDASEGATATVRYITDRLRMVPFATIDPEDFYIFSDTRPQTRFNDDDLREIVWPTNQFSYIEEFGGQNRSLVTLVGVEPDLKWRTFGEIFFEICKRCSVTEVVLLGSLLAPVPHTRPVPTSGSTSRPEVRNKMEDMGVMFSRYEGPTGIVGALTIRAQQEGLLQGSLWGAASNYLSASPNWKVTSQLLELLNQGWQLNLPLGEVQRMANRFESQVSQVVKNQEDVAQFVHELEMRFDSDDYDDSDDDEDIDELEEMLRGGSDEMSDPARNGEELPSAELLIQDLERHLNLRRDDDKRQ